MWLSASFTTHYNSQLEEFSIRDIFPPSQASGGILIRRSPSIILAMLTRSIGLISKVGGNRQQCPDGEQNDPLLEIAHPSVLKVTSRTRHYFLSFILLASFICNLCLLLNWKKSLSLHEVCSSFTSQFRTLVSPSQSHCFIETAVLTRYTIDRLSCSR